MQYDRLAVNTVAATRYGGASALAGYEIDGAVNIYAGYYNNPFLI